MKVLKLTKDDVVYYFNIDHLVNLHVEFNFIYVATTTMTLSYALHVKDSVEAEQIIKEVLRQIEYNQKSPIIDINDIQIKLRKEKENTKND